MTDKEIINELNHIRNSGVSILGKTALRLAMEKIEKLEKIEQILQTRSFTDDIGNACYLDDSERVRQIFEVIER